MGSGTTAMVAKQHDRYYMGCELHEDYGELIKNRQSEATEGVSQANGLTDLFY